MEEDIEETLLDLGACRMCCKRFALVGQSHRLYQELDIINAEQKALFSSEEQGSAAKKKKQAVCISCLDILGAAFNHELNKKIRKEVEDNSFEVDNVAVAITVPMCLSLRQLSICCYLKKNFVSYEKIDFEDILPVKDTWKITMTGSVCSILKGQWNKHREDLMININVNYKNDEEECSGLVNIFPNRFKHRKFSAKHHNETFTRKAVDDAISDVRLDQFQKVFPCPPCEPKSNCTVDNISLQRNPVFVAGRYMKFSRDLPQTPWVINNIKMKETSIQELITSALKHAIQVDDIKFSASGREDVDVRTLGEGRPFACELLNARRINIDLKEVQNRINESRDLQVRDLQFVKREDVGKLKEGEESKTKSYTAYCKSVDPLTDSDMEKLTSCEQLVLQQKTPIRVLHRRPLAVRERSIYEMSAHLLDKHHFKLLLTSQAGTYIKEFVHGDFGRTTPNVRLILNKDVDISALDVESISLDWPPKL